MKKSPDRDLVFAGLDTGLVESPLARNLLAPTAEDNPSLKALKKISDVVLAYRPKSKQPKPLKRKKGKKR
jgi:hypothetical protein